MSVTISAVIPVFDSSLQLRCCLERLERSAVKPVECIVVDDGSTDGSGELAQQFGAKLVVTNGRFGPARARNLGAEIATGDILLFLDADVCVHSDTIALIEEAFSSDPELEALIGRYDDSPAALNFLSQYRNLLHAFTHQTSHRNATTFWSGCGAVRRKTFLEVGGFDQSYERPAIEDIEFGARLCRAGKKIKLYKEVQVMHLKSWSFRNLLKTDIFDRGIPWMELILREGHMPNDLNLRLTQRVSVALALLLLVVTGVDAAYGRLAFIAPALALVFFILGRYWTERYSFSWVTIGSIFLVLGTVGELYPADGLGRLTVPVMIGYALLLTREALARRRLRLRWWIGMIYGVYSIAAVCYLAHFVPLSPLSLSDLAILVLLILLNLKFYSFLSRRWGLLCTIAAIPVHWLYFCCSGISVLAAVVSYGGKMVLMRAPEYRYKVR